jgi:hypothetical protein
MPSVNKQSSIDPTLAAPPKTKPEKIGTITSKTNIIITSLGFIMDGIILFIYLLFHMLTCLYS